MDGRELVLTVSLFDVGESPALLAGPLARLGALLPLVAVAGWRVVSARLVRSRVARTSARDGWQALVDYRFRVVGQ